MSHFTTVKTKITDGDMLKRALVNLNYNVTENDIVCGYSGNNENADIVVKKANGYDLGFIKHGDSYSLIADFWGADEKKKFFLDKVTQRYSCEIILAESQNKGFTVDNQTTLEDGTIKIVVNRWI